jgi:hypothetical protein
MLNLLLGHTTEKAAESRYIGSSDISKKVNKIKSGYHYECNNDIFQYDLEGSFGGNKTAL